MLLETTSPSFLSFYFQVELQLTVDRSETGQVNVTLGVLSNTRLRSKMEYLLSGGKFRQRAK
jgi:hypothetical protein